MTGVMKRRDLILHGLATGALLSLPGRALARALPDGGLTEDFDKTFGLMTTPQAPATMPVEPPLPTFAPPNPAYDAKLVGIAKRELERAGNKVWRKDLVGIADFARASSLPRFHFVNMEAGTIRSFHVAHGRGSDPSHSGFLQQFSAIPGSEATSRGAYFTAEWYNGKYGTATFSKTDGQWTVQDHQRMHSSSGARNFYGELYEGTDCRDGSEMAKRWNTYKDAMEAAMARRARSPESALPSTCPGKEFPDVAAYKQFKAMGLNK